MTGTERHAEGAHRITEVEGLRVVTEHVPGVRSVSVGAWMDIGSSHEPDSCQGYAHFLEHLLFKGNERIDAASISRWFDGIGSDANAATTREYTVVHARVLDRHLAGSLRVFGEMVLAPALEQGDVDAEREVILEEIAMYDDSPSDVVHELADALVFPGHGLGRPIVGTAASITAALPDDVARFHAHHYRPEHLVISAAGAVDHDELVALVEEEFLARRVDAVTAGRGTIDPTRVDELPDAFVRRALVHGKDTEQVHLVLAGRGISRTDDRRYTAALLDTILGNAPSSRLFLEVRERRGLAYSVYSFLANHQHGGQVGIYVGVRPDRVRTVLEVVKGELERIVAEPPTEDELELAKGHLEGRMLLSLESTTVRGNRLGASLVTGMPIETLETTVERIRAVTAADVLELARDLFDPSRLSIAAVADDAEAVAEDLTSVLGIADVALTTDAAEVAAT